MIAVQQVSRNYGSSNQKPAIRKGLESGPKDGVKEGLEEDGEGGGSKKEKETQNYLKFSQRQIQFRAL